MYTVGVGCVLSQELSVKKSHLKQNDNDQFKIQELLSMLRHVLDMNYPNVLHWQEVEANKPATGYFLQL